MDVTGSCTVFGHVVEPFIFISSKTEMLQIIKRLEDKLKIKHSNHFQKLKGCVGSGRKKLEISCNVNRYKYSLIIN